jgi:tRNA dimethylallyltransferase
MRIPTIVITGATASGKTALSFELAKKYKGEIICADSMTVYRGMDIGTDKPTLQIPNTKYQIQKKNSDGSYTINGISHHLLDELNPDQEFNVSLFCKRVTEIVKEIKSRGHIPFIVGGSLFYIDAYVYDYSLPPVEPDHKLRKELEGEPTESLWNRLVELDPDAEWTVDRNNRRRLIRALEVCLKTGQPFTGQKSKKQIKEDVLYLAVDRPREELYQCINKRVDEMMEAGFLDEVRELYKKYDHNTAMQASGYKQLLEYIDGKTTLEVAVENTKRSHRNFAKRQLTWLKRNPDKILVHNIAEAVASIDTFLKNLNK